MADKSFQDRVQIASPSLIQIAELIGADMNTTSDQAMTFISGSSFIISEIVITNASTNLNTADDGEFWTGLGRSGEDVAYINTGGGNGLQQLTTANKFIFIGPNGSNDITINEYHNLVSTLYFSLATSQGSVATADVRIYGYKIS